MALTPVKISPHVYYFHGHTGMADPANQGFMSNAGFVVTPDGVVVFDALGTPALGEAMVSAIRTVTAQPIRRVIVSHYHADHFYGLQAFKAAGAEVWAHENGRQYLSSDIAPSRLAQRKADLKPWVNENTRLVPADRWLHFDAGKTIPFTLGGVHFRVIDMSGAHSPEDIMLAVDEDKMLFAGDLFFTGRIPFVGEADSKVWLGALDDMLKIAPASRGARPRRDVARAAEGPAADPVVPAVPAPGDGRCGGRHGAVRGGLSKNRLESVRFLSGIRPGKPDQCLPDLPADGAREPAGKVAPHHVNHTEFP